MNGVKEAVIKVLDSLPENCSYEDVLYHIYAREKIERGLEAIEKGDYVSQAVAEQRINRNG